MARTDSFTPEEAADIGPDDLTPQQRTGPNGDPGHPGDLTPEEEATAERQLASSQSNAGRPDGIIRRLKEKS